MNLQLVLAQGELPLHLSGRWGFVALVLLILFVTLVVSEGSKDKEK